MVNKLRFGKERVITRSIELLEKAKDAGRRENEQAYETSRQIADLSSKLLMLEQLNTKGYLATDVYLTQSRELAAKITALKKDRSDMLSSALDGRIAGLKELESAIASVEKPLEAFDKPLFDSIVENITVDGSDKAAFTVKGGLKFTEPL